MTIQSYLDQLRKAADAEGVELKQAFINAGLNTSAFYRSLKGSSMSLATAERVMAAINPQS